MLVLWIFLAAAAITLAEPSRWTPQQAKDWYKRQPWLVGSNYIPSSAINELEMWQADTFDIKAIDADMARAESLGMNTMRVFLHDLLWQQDPEGFRRRIDQFLSVAASHKVRPMFVLFDSCWAANPKLGKQPEPTPGVHNSGWVQSPGGPALQDPSQYARLEAYVKGVVGAFAQDDRVLAWDVWNEPDNKNNSSYAKYEPANKIDLVLALLPKVFDWARSANPSQPLTSGVWQDTWWPASKLTPMAKIQIENSDVISFHNYDPTPKLQQHIDWLKHYDRPLLCTEYMARGNGSTFQSSLPVFKKENIAAYNWGFTAGKTQTYLPWDSWQHPYTDREPKIWFHEIFRQDGTPYKADEVSLIRSLTGKQPKAKSAGAR